MAIRNTSSKSIVVLADMHIGNNWALCSPEWFHVFHKEDREFHRMLYEDGWLGCLDKLQNKNPFLHALNGDIIDGDNRKTLGEEVWSTNVDHQIQDAKRLLGKHKVNNIICTTGSGYHQKNGATSFEQILARELNAICRDGRFAQKVINWQDKKNKIKRSEGTEPTGTNGSTKFAEYSWWVEIYGRIFSFTHHVPYAKWAAYRTTALAREMAALELDSRKTIPDGRSPSFVVRSHAHYAVEVRFGTTWGIITPAWKFPDEHLYRGGEGGNTPNVGIVEIIIEQNGERNILRHELSGIKFPKRAILNLTPEYKGPLYG